jgi:hypothetical protein
MKKSTNFDVLWGPGWPTPQELEPYFLGGPGRPSSFEVGSGGMGFSAEGVDGTDHLEEGKGRIDLCLTMVGSPFHGVLFHYRKSGAGRAEVYYSRGDLRRLREWVGTNDGDLNSVGLFVPLERAWKAVKDFIESEGALPGSIAWIADDDVPGYAFLDPATHILYEDPRHYHWERALRPKFTMRWPHQSQGDRPPWQDAVATAGMRKRANVHGVVAPGWPTPRELEPHFFQTPGRSSSLEANGDCLALNVEGAGGTAHLKEWEGRIDIQLTALCNPFRGVLLHYWKFGGGHAEMFYSQGDLRRLQEWVQTRDGELMPVGLFLPFETAWQAVKEYIETDGALPRSIAWFPGEDVPPYAFPRFDPEKR